MNKFSIKDLQQFSGIKAHTIRIWEQRYKALQPRRSGGNTRLYDDKQLKRLLNIVSLMNNEYKVSELCLMSDEELRTLLEKHLQTNANTDNAIEYLISQCISAALEFSENKFDKLISHAILRFGVVESYKLVIYPMLVRLGIMWAKDTFPTAQEHFVSNLIRQKLHTAIDSLPSASSSAKKWLLFLLEDELHETGLLLAKFILRKAGHDVVYLGSNVPFSSIQSAVNELKPTDLLFFMVRKNDEANDLDTINQMKMSFPNQTIHLATDSSRLNKVKSSSKLIRYFSVDDLESYLNHV